MEKSHKFKVVLSKQAEKSIKRASPKDRKMLEKAIKKLADDPFVGKPADYLALRPMPWEECHCKKPVTILWDRNSDEVDISCTKGRCDLACWATKKEFDSDREKHRQKLLDKTGCKGKHFWVAKCPSGGCRFAWCEICDSTRECCCKGCCQKGKDFSALLKFEGVMAGGPKFKRDSLDRKFD